MPNPSSKTGLSSAASPHEAAGEHGHVAPPAKVGAWRFVVNVLVIGAFLAAGLFAGPWLRAGYDRLFPPAAFVTGDFDRLYQDAGKPVVVFSTSTCPFCKRAREMLARENVDYRDFVVDQSPDAERRFEELGGGAVPQVFIGDRRIMGFREQVIRESLALQRR